MHESDPVLAALATVEDDPAAADPTEEIVGAPELEEPADSSVPVEGDEPADEESGFSLYSWAQRVPEGSHLDFDARDWWDPETGGKHRLAFHLSDATGDGVGYPNVLGVLVGFAELYVETAKEGDGFSLFGSKDDADDGTEGLY